MTSSRTLVNGDIDGEMSAQPLSASELIRFAASSEFADDIDRQWRLLQSAAQVATDAPINVHPRKNRYTNVIPSKCAACVRECACSMSNGC